MEELAKHFTAPQIVELTAVVSLYGLLNQWNDSMATPLEEKSLEFAKKHLSGAGWETGKH